MSGRPSLESLPRLACKRVPANRSFLVACGLANLPLGPRRAGSCPCTVARRTRHSVSSSSSWGFMVQQVRSPRLQHWWSRSTIRP
eukprot:scaffold332_cov308-Pavlova_lutheri.AAC.7